MQSSKRAKKFSVPDANKYGSNADTNNQNNLSDDESEPDEGEQFKYVSEKELKKGSNAKEYIFSLFTRKIYAEIYFAWCKDCNEPFSAESAKYFRDELLVRNNKDLRNFNFRSMRISKNFLLAFVGNLAPGAIKKVELADNMISDLCMHNIKSLISAKGVEYLNLASNMISTEGLKIIQNEVMSSRTLKYLNLGIIEGSFRRNNFSGEGGIIIARILLNNYSIETLILQDNELGEDSGDKIGASLIKNQTLRKLVLSDNKIKNKGARSIIENGVLLTSLNLANNEISAEICYELKKLILSKESKLKEIVWDGNNIGLKGISYIEQALKESSKIKSLSLKNTSIGVTGILSLAEGLYSNKSLEVLDIGSNSINYNSFVKVCDALNCNNIKCLKCKNNLLGDESMKYFASRILSKNTTSSLKAFDFSSCKIYDQGLIFLLNELQSNEKITWINLKDNYFSHEIDFVILNFLEKNKKLTYLDLTKNRFTFQCLQKVSKIIKRNKKIQNDKEPNRLLVELYSLKYENTKLNELKDTLKNIENYNEKLRLNKLDLRQDYEIFKNSCDEKYNETAKVMEKNQQLLNIRKKELEEKTQTLEKIKAENSETIQGLDKQLNDIKGKKNSLEEAHKKAQEESESTEKELMKKINELSDQIEANKKKEAEFMKEVKATAEEIIKVDRQIKEKQESLANRQSDDK